MMKLLVGLGNPGSEYAMNRHNVGFMAVDRIHGRWHGGPWRRKFHSLVSEANVAGQRVMFVKPMTYMNESGKAVADAMRFYKIALQDVVVIHDEIDLAPGKFRVKTGGGTGGHNGLKSISAYVKDGYRRLRLGVGHPGRKEMVASYVLHDFARADGTWLGPLLDAIADEAPELLEGRDGQFANKVHAILNANAKANPKPVAPRPAVPRTVLAQNSNKGAPNSPFMALAQFFRK
ncbi:MAG: aminoacyl-tRNA hydrolase [Devosia sp.]